MPEVVTWSGFYFGIFIGLYSFDIRLVNRKEIFFFFSLSFVVINKFHWIRRKKKNICIACQSTTTNDRRVIHYFHYNGMREEKENKREREREGEEKKIVRVRCFFSSSVLIYLKFETIPIHSIHIHWYILAKRRRKKDCACSMFFFIISSNLFEV